MNKRPTFLIIGAPKCATSRMHALLDVHPQVCMSRIKEPRFFSHKRPWERGWAWYESLFEPTEETIARGESSTDYCMATKFPHIVDRIKENLPDVRLIYMVRHPIRRMESLWLMERSSGGNRADTFAERVRHADTFVDVSCYWKQLSCYLEAFGQDRIHVVFLEDLKRDERREVNACLKFIGVDPKQYPSPSLPGGRRTRADRRADRWITRQLRSWPMFEGMRAKAPARFRGWARRMLTSPADVRVEWDQELYDEAVARIRPDAERFLEWCGKPPTFWQWPTDVSAVNDQVMVAEQKAGSGWWNQ